MLNLGPLACRVGKNFSLSMAGSVTAMVLAILRVSILTKTLSVAEYARIGITLNLYVALGSFLSFRVGEVIYRFYPGFSEKNEFSSMRGLVAASLVLAVSPALLVTAGILLFAPQIAESAYDDPSLSPLFRIYSVTMLVSCLSSFYTPILRLADRLRTIIIPQILGNLTALAGIAIYLYFHEEPSLSVLAAILAAGMIAQAAPPALAALLAVRRQCGLRFSLADAASLLPLRKKMAGTLFNTNLVGYLKVLQPPADLFLVGLLGTHTDFAMYDIARKLTAPLFTVQNSIQTAVTPEIHDLRGREAFGGIWRIVVKYLKLCLAAGLPILFLAALAAPTLISWIAREEYLSALPSFYFLLGVIFLTLLLSGLYPVAISLDMLRWLNLGLLIGILILAAYVQAYHLSAHAMAAIQFFTTLILCFVFGLPVLFKLKKLAGGTA